MRDQFVTFGLPVLILTALLMALMPQTSGQFVSWVMTLYCWY